MHDLCMSRAKNAVERILRFDWFFHYSGKFTSTVCETDQTLALATRAGSGYARLVYAKKYQCPQKSHQLCFIKIFLHEQLLSAPFYFYFASVYVFVSTVHYPIKNKFKQK